MILLDTNILARLLQPTHPDHDRAADAISFLHGDECTLVIVPQVLYELWVIATRPKAANGLGLTSVETDSYVRTIRLLFPLLPDWQDIFREWQLIVRSFDVVGRAAHDARLVAAMKVHRVGHILTFDARDFVRYQDIEVIHPASFVA